MADPKADGMKPISKSNQQKADGKKQISTQFYYENRDNKTKFRHSFIRLKDKLYHFRRYQMFYGYGLLCVGTFCIAYFKRKIIYGWDTPATNFGYYKQKREGTLTEEQLASEARVKFVYEANLERKQRTGHNY